MYNGFNKLIAIIAITLFCVAQAKGWNLFEDRASSHGGSSGSSRTYHK